MASLIINSKINARLFSVIGPYQHLIYANNYDFLDHDCYIDGYTIHEFNAARIIAEAVYIGNIGETDLRESIDHLIDSGNIKPAVLKRYRLKRSK